jgi:hypothetical protein
MIFKALETVEMLIFKALAMFLSVAPDDINN